MSDTITIPFTKYDVGTYRTFLRTKLVPEGRYDFDHATGAYLFSCPSRFAPMLGIEAHRARQPRKPWSLHLRRYQCACLEMALDCKRFAFWWDTGLGKTAAFLEFAMQVLHITGGRVLIVSPLQIIDQTCEEFARWYPDAQPIQRMSSPAALRDFGLHGSGIAIANFDKFNDGVIEELRHLDGVILDESSMLKAGGGTQKWNFIKSTKGVEFKLSCTATPAPNDVMEYASQAGWLEKLRTEGEILWTFFNRNKRGEWAVKPHAQEAFYRFMSSWSIYLRNPARYGWEDVLRDLPQPEIIYHEIEPTQEQRDCAMHEKARRTGDMLGDMKMGVVLRQKLSQLAKGFLYSGGKAGTKRVASNKPDVVAGIVRGEVADGRQVLVWTLFDEEATILLDSLSDIAPAVLNGSTPQDERWPLIQRFRAGEVRVLVTRADMLGKGLNFQFCTAMVFSGFNDSFESIYQAERRCYRPGQTRTVRIHVPIVSELEGAIFENVESKRRAFEADCKLCESLYLSAIGGEVCK